MVATGSLPKDAEAVSRPPANSVKEISEQRRGYAV